MRPGPETGVAVVATVMVASPYFPTIRQVPAVSHRALGFGPLLGGPVEQETSTQTLGRHWDFRQSRRSHLLVGASCPPLEFVGTHLSTLRHRRRHRGCGPGKPSPAC